MIEVFFMLRRDCLGMAFCDVGQEIWPNNYRRIRHNDVSMIRPRGRRHHLVGIERLDWVPTRRAQD